MLVLLLLLSFVALLQGLSISPNVKVIEKANGNGIEEFDVNHPEAVLLKPLVRELPGKSFELKYELGARKAGDSVVFHETSPKVVFHMPSNPQVQMVCPSPDIDEVTFLRITTYQNSRKGDAYVSNGGIGRKHILFTVNAYGTKNWQWEIEIYARRT
ncbi:uncharacterized protein LOC115622474 [Scaptodrosophila lebanonensis]|uniref:Uncharacterized protein LOC115622474 n=1 Tax=Drosophila lebanonensis TaxID=7225 RepID=A0A6J2TB00_DROLE|nr:uncharacterized protein LOC115622474 [Scaptodrosophila lebanonensis]